MKPAGKQNLAVAGLSFGVFALLVLLLSTTQNGAQSSYREEPSSFYTDASGTKAIFLVLQEFLPSAQRWMKPLDLLPIPERGDATTLLIIGPADPLDSEEARALDRWIARGGQLIVALERPWPIQMRDSEQRGAPFLLRHGFSFTPAEEPAGALGQYDDPAGSLILGGTALQAGEFTTLFSHRSVIKGGQKRFGAGRIVVIADARAWSNDRLAQSQNAVWLVSTVFSWGNGRLLVDEYHHGFQKSRGPAALIASFMTSFWGLVFVQLAVAGLLLIWLRARRFGPVIELPVTRRQDPLGRVDSLATLLATAKATSFAFQSIHQFLLRRLRQLRFGAPGLKSTAGATIGQSSFSEGYLSLLRRQDEANAPREEEMYRVAREAGKIIREYKSGRQNP